MNAVAGERSAARQPSSRSTRQLDATLRALCSSREHPSAEQVFHSVRREIPSISLATVYRNLQKLVAAGCATTVAASHRSLRFDGRTDVHDHFLCRSCGAILDVEPSRARRTPRRLARSGHRVDETSLMHMGACARCCHRPVRARARS